MDDLISRKATGSPKDFSKKLGFSKRTLMGYIQAMKHLGFPIEYDKKREAYFYKQNGQMNDHWFIPLDKIDQKLTLLSD